MSPAARRRSLAALFLALFAAQQALLWFAYYAHGAKTLIGDEQGYQATALAILGGGPWMPSTIWPPLQPLLLAALYGLFGPHVWAAQLVQTLLFIGCGALLRDLWRILGGSVAAANAAAALFLLNPATAAYAHWLWPEIPHLFLLLAALCLLARAPARPQAFAAGTCIGLAILAKSLLSVFWPAFLLAFVRRERPFVAWRPAALFVLGLALTTAPALLHGWREYGKPMIADSSVYNLWVGLTDRWRSDYVEDMGGATLPAFIASGATPQQRNAIYLDKVRAVVAEQGLATTLAHQLERQYFRLFSAKTPLLSQLPGPACAGHLAVYRTSPWLTDSLGAWNDLFHALTLVTFGFGIACWRWRCNVRSTPVAPRAIRWLPDDTRDALQLIVALFIAWQLALFLLIHVKARFLLPMLPFLCGFGGSFVADVGARSRVAFPDGANSTPRFAPLRLAFGALLAALLLFLAFAGPSLDRLCTG
jgi:4-amino-4-deoxy-L-arabinose transferase-like glycosyltransferase